jgi:hypothetical protein
LLHVQIDAVIVWLGKVVLGAIWLILEIEYLDFYKLFVTVVSSDTHGWHEYAIPGIFPDKMLRMVCVGITRDTYSSRPES